MMDIRKQFGAGLALLSREEGHGAPLPGLFIAAAGMVLLGIGAANDTGWLAVVGGIGGAVGLVAAFVVNHSTVEKDIFGRLDKLEK